MLRVLVADDHAVVRKGLVALLREAGEPASVGEAADGAEVLEKVRAEPWDIVILDVGLPVLNGIVALRFLKNEFPDLPVLMLSIYTNRFYINECMKAGASGYLCKEAAPDELLAAIHTVLDGGSYVSPSAAASSRRPLGSPPAGL